MPERINANWVAVISIDTASRWRLVGIWNEPTSESLVPDGQPVAVIPVEDLDAVAAAIDEQEQVAGRGVLAEGSGHQAGERIEAFAEIGSWGVQEHSDGMTGG